VGFVVDTVALGQVFSEHLGFPCHFSFHRLLHIHHHHHHLSSGAATTGQLVSDIPSGLSVTNSKKLAKKKKGLKKAAGVEHDFLVKRRPKDGIRAPIVIHEDVTLSVGF
jgi:hypothetical protein